MSSSSNAVINSDYVKGIRRFELFSVINEMPPNSHILEIGAGAGWQAEMLSEHGFKVEAIDIKDSRYLQERVWDVQVYDGRHIPFPDASFDIVFSSNVLEHIAQLEALQKEIRRVLKPAGMAIHILPSTAWRFWTLVTHYPHILKVAGLSALRSLSSNSSGRGSVADYNYNKYKLMQLVWRAIWPARHGERGNSLTELYLFSRRNWIAAFAEAGWEVTALRTNKVFYTGNMLFGKLLSIKLRSRLSNLLGRCSTTYVVRPVSE
jgi:SAM-dependent methyltransferase